MLDVSTPSAPQKMSEGIHTRGIVYGLYWDSCGLMLYIAAGGGGLEIWDITDPTAPQKLGCYDTPGYAYSGAVSGDYAYVAGGYSGLRVVDISMPSNPHEIGYYDTPDYARGVAVSDSYAYVADGYTGIQIYENLLIGLEERGDGLFREFSFSAILLLGGI